MEGRRGHVVHGRRSLRREKATWDYPFLYGTPDEGVLWLARVCGALGKVADCRDSKLGFALRKK